MIDIGLIETKPCWKLKDNMAEFFQFFEEFYCFCKFNSYGLDNSSVIYINIILFPALLS